ncbi:MAG: sugar ABC transporter substrate-binding protein [Oscillospiraceae bacterium]|nr:MAG: sugar ABC transporter substrate-binding protein [Oscillospiraceae bacterium]
MEWMQQSAAGFTECLASPSPVPGGGGASALVGAIGIALGDMVGELTVGKKRYADSEERIKQLMQRAQELRIRLLECAEKDAQVFEPLSKAYKIPREDPQRAAVLERCLRAAAAVPLEIFDLCREAIDVEKEFAEKGSAMVISDAATGIALCCAAMQGAAVNVKVNTRLMKDREWAEKLDSHIDQELKRYTERAEWTYKEVYRRLSDG